MKVVLTGHQGGSSNTHRQAGTCARCKSRKVKCEWLEEAQACRSCVKGGAQGTCAPSRQEKAVVSTRQSTRSSSCEPSIMVPRPLPTNPVISKPRNMTSLKQQLEDENIPQKPAKTRKHTRSALLSDSYSSSSTFPRTESSELVTIPEIDEESNNESERPESTILVDGTPLPLSISYKRVVNFLERCNDDDMGQVGAERNNCRDRDDMMDISDSDESDADNSSESDCDNSESDGMSKMNARKVPQRGRPKKAVGSKRLGSRSRDSRPPEDVQLRPDPETCGKLKLFLINLAHTCFRLCHPMQRGQYRRK